MECEVETLVAEVASGGVRGSVHVEPLGGWQWGTGRAAHGGSGTEEDGAASMVVSQRGGAGEALDGKCDGPGITGLVGDGEALQVVGLCLVGVAVEFGGVAEAGWV